MATIHDLPLELLGDFLGLLSVPEDLYSAALVCRGWREPAQRALFGDDMLPRRRQSDPSAWLSSSVRARYRVHTLTLYDTVQDSFLEEVSSARPAVRSLKLCGEQDGGGYDFCQRLGDRDRKSVV